MSAYSDSTFLIDLKLVLTDAVNYVTREVFHPAFFVRNDGVGISEANLHNKVIFSIYHNPATDRITISYSGFVVGSFELTIFDSRGWIVMEKKFIDETYLDVSTFDPGILYQDEDG